MKNQELTKEELKNLDQETKELINGYFKELKLTDSTVAPIITEEMLDRSNRLKEKGIWCFNGLVMWY